MSHHTRVFKECKHQLGDGHVVREQREVKYKEKMKISVGTSPEAFMVQAPESVLRECSLRGVLLIEDAEINCIAFDNENVKMSTGNG